jgi:hypothetical protein
VILRFRPIDETEQNTDEPILAIVEKDEDSRKVASRTKTVARGIAPPATRKSPELKGRKPVFG